MTPKRQSENKEEKLVGSILSVWSILQTRVHPSGRETAVLCLKTVVQLAKWRKLLERGD